MRMPLTALILSAAIVAALPAAYAQDSSNGQPYWGKRADGWHFYHDPKPKKKALEPEPEPQPQPVVIAPPAPPPAPMQPEGPKPLSAAWLRENMPKYQERAIDDPSPENVELYAFLQRLSMDKAEKYSQAVVQATIRNPALDEYARSSLTTAQRNATEENVTVAKAQTLNYLSQRIGIWYFYQSTCPYCKQQEPILDRLSTRFDFSILNISLDGGPLASGSPKPFVLNKGHAEQLGVMTTPTMVIADTLTNKVYNLAAGLRTSSELEERILTLAKTEQWITDAQYDEAVRGAPRRYITDGLQNLDQLQDDPAQLLEALKRASTSGSESPWIVAPTN